MTTAMHEKLDVLLDRTDHNYERRDKDDLSVRVVAMAELPTRFGDFHIVAFENNRDGKEHIAITKGDVIGASDVPVRLHSECLTGDVMGSLRCDCRAQLERSLSEIGAQPKGVVDLSIAVRKEPWLRPTVLRHLRSDAIAQEDADKIIVNVREACPSSAASQSDLCREVKRALAK